MPKYRYNKHFGVLSMLPFGFSFLGFFSMPFLILSEESSTQKSINGYLLHVGYFIVIMFTMPVFLAFNLAVAPFAYLKTIVHKFRLWRHYKGSNTL